jgi:hypothetical protein
MVPSHLRQADPALYSSNEGADPRKGPALSFRYIDGIY